MKTKLAILISAILFFSTGLHAQKSKKKNKVYKVWVSKIDNSKKIKGLLYEVNNESLKIIGKRSTEINIDASTIKMIKIRRKGRVGRGVLIGALSGFAVGGIIGLASGDDPDETVQYGGGFAGWWYIPYTEYTIEGETAMEKAMSTGTGLAFLGGGAGAIIASKKKKISINGDINNYTNQLDVLKSFITY